ncbi:MAG: hypothetical protein WA944_19430 [Mycobacterium sp.]
MHVLDPIQLGNEPITRDHVLNAVRWADADAGPALLLMAWRSGRLDTETLARLIPTIWCRASCPQNRIPPREWRAMFTATGYRSGGQPASPPTSIRLYRGSPYVERQRWAWTPNPLYAMFYAAQRLGCAPHRKPGQVWVIDAPAASLLAHVDRVDPGEYLVDTKGLAIGCHLNRHQLLAELPSDLRERLWPGMVANVMRLIAERNNP